MKPLIVTLANGVEIVASRVVDLPIAWPGPERLEQVQFCYVIPELHTPVVLGYDWLREHNPHIDWQAGLITLPAGNASFYAT